jgi:predicted PurR-regulated permease PerM
MSDADNRDVIVASPPEAQAQTSGHARKPVAAVAPSPAATRWVALVVVTAAVAYLCWLIVAPFLDVIMWAVVLVVAFQPLHRRVQARVKSPARAAVVSTLLVLVTILVPLLLAGTAVVHDTVRLGRALQANRGTLLDPRTSPALDRAATWVGAHAGVAPEDLRAYVADKARQLGGIILGKSLGVLGNVLGVVVQAFMVVFTMFYLFRDGPRLRAALGDLLPLERRQARDVFQRAKDVILASVYGSLVIAAVQGTLGGLAFWVLGLPSPLLWGVVMILLSIIPMAGSAIVWVPAAIYLAASGHWVKATFLAVWGAGVIGTIDNVLRPRLVGGRTRLHDLVVFFAVLGGIQVFGILGVITGPVIAAVAFTLVEVWRESRRAPAAAAVCSP